MERESSACGQFMKRALNGLCCCDGNCGCCDSLEILMRKTSKPHVVGRQPKVANLSAVWGGAPYHFHQVKSPYSRGHKPVN